MDVLGPSGTSPTSTHIKKVQLDLLNGGLFTGSLLGLKQSIAIKPSFGNTVSWIGSGSFVDTNIISIWKWFNRLVFLTYFFLRSVSFFFFKFLRRNSWPKFTYFGFVGFSINCTFSIWFWNEIFLVNNWSTNRLSLLSLQVVDVTIAYPEGKPLDLVSIITGWRPPCTSHVHYR